MDVWVAEEVEVRVPESVGETEGQNRRCRGVTWEVVGAGGRGRSRGLGTGGDEQAAHRGFVLRLFWFRRGGRGGAGERCVHTGGGGGGLRGGEISGPPKNCVQLREPQSMGYTRSQDTRIHRIRTGIKIQTCNTWAPVPPDRRKLLAADPGSKKWPRLRKKKIRRGDSNEIFPC